MQNRGQLLTLAELLHTQQFSLVSTLGSLGFQTCGFLTKHCSVSSCSSNVWIAVVGVISGCSCLYLVQHCILQLSITAGQIVTATLFRRPSHACHLFTTSWLTWPPVSCEPSSAVAHVFSGYMLVHDGHVSFREQDKLV